MNADATLAYISQQLGMVRTRLDVVCAVLQEVVICGGHQLCLHRAGLQGAEPSGEWQISWLMQATSACPDRGKQDVCQCCGRTTCTAASVKSLRAASERRIWADLSLFIRPCEQRVVSLCEGGLSYPAC